MNEQEVSNQIALEFNVSKYERIIYERFFPHFALRLSERYDVFITFEEYVFLCRLPYIRNSKKTRKRGTDNTLCQKGFLKIKDKDVEVIKGLGFLKPLITAIPKTKKNRRNETKKNF